MTFDKGKYIAKSLLLGVGLNCGCNAIAETDLESLTHKSLLKFAELSCDTFNNETTEALRRSIANEAQHTLATQVTVEQSDIEVRGRRLGQRLTLTVGDSAVIELQFLSTPARPAQTVLTSFISTARHSAGKPSTQLVLNADCTLRTAHTINYKNSQTAEFVQPLRSDGSDLVASGEPDWINPSLPQLPAISPARLKIALVDSGVNYMLPQIRKALARDTQGQMIGYDFWDMDSTPYDANPARSPFFIQRHGTRTASIVAAEAPTVAIVPYRYPRPDMSRMKQLVEHANANDVRIIGMPLGSNRYKDWVAFDQAARAHPDILFIVSAGNNGRDIDRKAVYPAAMDIPNMLVVTSADDFVSPAERTNYGRIAVDYLVPAENIQALDYDGTVTSVSGSSYAVSRLVALAARLLEQNPALSRQQLQQMIREKSVRANTGKYVAAGYIGDPLAPAQDLQTTPRTTSVSDSPAQKYQLPVAINILDDRWTQSEILNAVAHANTLFKQCKLTMAIKAVQSVETPPYLKDLSTGHALTLRRKLGKQPLTVFMARDTIMNPQFDAEAFGEGNTRNRPWMRNTLWVTYGIDDTGIALAHELFHIVANDGSHTTAKGNLMNNRTDPDNIRLTQSQCDAMISNGLNAELVIAGE